MGCIVVSEFVTLDGVIEDPGGAEQSPHGGWAFKFERGDEGNQFKVDELTSADALLLGRGLRLVDARPSADTVLLRLHRA